MVEGVTDNPAARRFELAVEGQVAFVQYERKNDRIVFLHTEVPPAFRGQGVGENLVRGALDAARREGLRVVPVCPFVKAYLRKHPDAGDVQGSSVGS